MYVHEHTQQVIAMQARFHASLGNSSAEATLQGWFSYLPLYYVYMNYTPATLPLIYYCDEVCTPQTRSVV